MEQCAASGVLGVCCGKLQVMCVLFREAFCVKGLCLLYFHHAKKCLNHPNTYCYVCSEMTFKSQRQISVAENN